MPKCGSTALQMFLRDNRSALLERGIDYPALSPGQAGNLTPYAISGRPPEMRRWFTETYPNYEISKAEFYLRRALAAPKAPCVLLSSEALAVHAHRVDIDWIRDFFGAVHVHIFFRRRAAFFASAYEQLVRALAEHTDMETFLNANRERKELLFANQLERWQAFAGKERVHIHFLSHDRPGIDVQMMTELGIDAATLPTPISRANVAKSAFVHCVLAHANRRKFIATLQDKSRIIEIAEKHDPDPAARLLTPELAHRIDTMFADDTEEFLAMQTVISREELHTDPAILPPSTTFAEIEAMPVFDAVLRQISVGLAASVAP